MIFTSPKKKKKKISVIPIAELKALSQLRVSIIKRSEGEVNSKSTNVNSLNALLNSLDTVHNKIHDIISEYNGKSKYKLSASGSGIVTTTAAWDASEYEKANTSYRLFKSGSQNVSALEDDDKIFQFEGSQYSIADDGNLSMDDFYYVEEEDETIE